MNPKRMTALTTVAFALSISLLNLSAHAQVNGGKPAANPTATPEPTPPGMVGVVDGSVVENGSQTVTMEDLMKSVETDLQLQGVSPGSPMTPPSGRYLLRFGSPVTREFIYINATKGTIRWEDRSPILTFNPANLPEQILAKMMSTGRLVKLHLPSNDDYASALEAELKQLAVNVETPTDKNVHVKLGFKYTRLSLTFSPKDGTVEWAYIGAPFMKGSYAEGMLHSLQEKGMLKAPDGTNLIILHGSDLLPDDEKANSFTDKADSALDNKTPPKKATPDGAQKSPAKNDSPTPPTKVVPVVAKISMAYSVTSDQDDYNSSSDVGVSVKGAGQAQQGTAGAGDGVFGANGGPGGNGIGNGTGTGEGGGTGNGIGGIGDGVGDGQGRTYYNEATSSCGGKTHNSHGQGSTVVPINYGSTAGTVHILFDAYAIPDELFIRCGGKTVASTNGLVHAKHELQFEYHPFGSGDKANICFVTVAANENTDTKWQFGTSCPGQLYEEQQ